MARRLAAARPMMGARRGGLSERSCRARGEHQMDRIQPVKKVSAELLGSHPIEQPVAGSGNDPRVTDLVGSNIVPLVRAVEKEQQFGLFLPAQIGDLFD